VHPTDRSFLLARRLLVATAVLALGCGADSGPDRGSTPRWLSPDAAARVAEADRYGGTLVVAGRNDIQSMNALVSNDFESAQHQIYVLFVTLVRSDGSYEPRPYLARSWEFDADTSEVVFHLRDDLRWHDGTPVTAGDVVFTFERIKDPEVGFVNPSYFDYWQAAEAVDDSTVRFYLRPHANLLYGWTRTAIMPEHIIGYVEPAELDAHEFGTTNPVGNGPFRFVERVAGDHWVFEANPDFPTELGGRPYLDRLVYRQIPDEFVLAAALQTGEVDLVIDGTPAMLERLADDTTMVVVSYHAPDYNFIAWNSKRAPFADPRVRRALTMAIDRPTVVQALRGGHGTVASGPVGPWHWAYDSTWAPLAHAPDSARALLEAAGWTDTDDDGVRDRNGVPFRFELYSTPRHEWRSIQTMVQASLADVGVDARMELREPGALIPLVTGADRRFDAVLVGWARDVPLDDRDLWACDQVGQPVQFTSYCNPELDVVLDSIRVTADRVRLRDLIRRYHEAISEDQPYTFLYYVDKVDLHRAGTHGVEMDSRGDWVGVVGWWIHPDARR
jgi:peptide/nickel transport system substrate-binding protein